MAKTKIIEASFPRYKITISIDPVDEEIGKSKITKKEFIFRANDVENKLYRALSVFTEKFYEHRDSLKNVWVIGHSLDKDQFGIIEEKCEYWSGYSVFFPNGLGNRKDPHYRTFHQNYLTSTIEHALDYWKVKDKDKYMKNVLSEHLPPIGGVTGYKGSNQIHWDSIAFDIPKNE